MNCDICTNELKTACLTTCEAKGRDEPCPISYGVCGHSYHRHCITHWKLRYNNECPLCDDITFQELDISFLASVWKIKKNKKLKE